MHDVFISYKSEEYDDAAWVRDILEENGITCWMAPASIPGGSDYAREIPVAIKACKLFVLVLSSRSQASRWVKRELDTALNEGKTVLPFVLERFELSEDFGFYLGVVQRYDATGSRLEAMDKMLREIKVILEIKEELAHLEQTPVQTPEAKARETVPEAVNRANMQRLLAQAGEPEEQFRMGQLYEQGEGVPYSLSDAMQWYKMAAEQGHAEANYRMGMCYLAGERKSKAVHWLQQAAYRGHAEAAYRLGMCYLDGIGVNENETQAIAYLEMAGNDGHLRAAFRLAQLHENRLASMEDGDSQREECFQTVSYWYKKAAWEEDPEALYRLGKLYEKHDLDSAMNYYRQAAEQAHALAQHTMARLYFAKNAPQKAVTWLEKAARLGAPDAQFDLARYYQKDGQARPQFADYWMEQAAEGGHGQAQYETACRYLQQADPEKAVGMLRFAANKGLPDAVCALALCYYAGNGVEKDEKTAASLLKYNLDRNPGHGPSAVYLTELDADAWRCLEQAAHHRHVPAMLMLADRLEKHSPTEAMFWYDRAAKCFRYANRYEDSRLAEAMFRRLKKKYALRWLLAVNLRRERKLYPYWSCTFHDPVLDRWLEKSQKAEG